MNTALYKACRRLIPVILFALLVSSPSPAMAHFQLNLNVRILHLEHTAEGANLYMRLPLPYLLADKVGKVIAPDALPSPAPFTRNAFQDGQLVHYVDFQQVTAAPLGLGEIAAQTTHITSAESSLRGEVRAVQLYPVGKEPDFATLEEAHQAFVSTPSAQRLPPTPLYVGDTVIDILIHYPFQGPLESYRVSSSLNPGLPNQEKTANLVLDYRAGTTQVFRASGLLSEPIEINHSAVNAMATFVAEGVVHILAGLDHVLFVLCLTLGAGTLSTLLLRATGFTIGHSITLMTGFFGLVPAGSWFVPLVETGIALSIIYVAWVSIRQTREINQPTEGTIILGTCLLGLLHGLGFSFVLHEILQVDSPNIWQSLLAFNVGVEVGQALIILLLWPLLLAARHWPQTREILLRRSIALSCCGIALFWTLDRSLQLFTALAA